MHKAVHIPEVKCLSLWVSLTEQQNCWQFPGKLSDAELLKYLSSGLSAGTITDRSVGITDLQTRHFLALCLECLVVNYKKKENTQGRTNDCVALFSFKQIPSSGTAVVLSVHLNSINCSGKAAEICLREDKPAIWWHITQCRTARCPIYSVWSKVKQLRARVFLQQWYCVNFFVCVCVCPCVFVLLHYSLGLCCYCLLFVHRSCSVY